MTQLNNKLKRYLSYLAQDKNNYHLMLQISHCHVQLGNLPEAEQYLKKASRCLDDLTNQPNAAPIGLLALLHFDTNNIKKAELLAHQALKINSEQFEALLVNILIKSLKNECSIAEIECLLQENPHESRLWYALGCMQMHEMNINKAIKAFLKTLHLWPHFFEARVNLEWCYLWNLNVI